MKLNFKFGPGALIAAAFIGPGTVTTCILSGVQFGYSLLWALLLSVLATILLQEMAVRLGLKTQQGLADVIQNQVTSTWLKRLVMVLILVAIILGNTAYEAGNLGGATLGLQALFGTTYERFYPLIIGLVAFAILWLGSYKKIERSLVTLVLFMSISFIIAALVTQPPLDQILKGLFVPKLPEGSTIMLLALIGTTVVPYNLFLHASLVNQKWDGITDLKAARLDTYIAIGLGGLVSMAIVICGAAVDIENIKTVLDMAQSLTPIYGASATYFIGIGLCAAGITSAITAPLAAAYVANSIFGWKATLKDSKFRAVWISILFVGVLSLSFGIKPIQMIKIAQVSNAILLPVIAAFLLWVVNKKKIMGAFTNTVFQNTVSIVILVFTIGLGVSVLLKLLGYL